ncbi:hypothetical protein PG994_003155 [Apiospora phragmitis]|uniref:Uncharacterized protein n=1 Tax=Apiospora phragmitis TaxID=2905665 RepID=A0ABR1W782_9PEZI
MSNNKESDGLKEEQKKEEQKKEKQKKEKQKKEEKQRNHDDTIPIDQVMSDDEINNEIAQPLLIKQS